MAESTPKYQVIRKLAEGAVAEVFLARAPGSSQDVVLKVLRNELTSDPAIVGRFLDESKICQQLDHPNVVKHLGAGRLPDGRVYMLTEYLEGEDLGSRIRSQGPLAPADLVRLLIPLCEALEYVHKRGIVHRDIKPDNVFLKGGLPGFTPKLIDFGLALFQGPKSVKTAAGVIVATPEYTPPECISGQKADARSDLYALGVLMYEALVGSPPFVATGYTDLLLKHLNEPPPRLPADCEHLTPIVHRLLAKEPGDRFQSAAALKAALKESDSPNQMQRTVHSEANASGIRVGVDAQVVGNYQIVKLLGEGAMGRVYLAKHTKLARQVALKLLRSEHAQNPQLVQRFFQEAQTVNQINHEHIVEIYDFIEEGGGSGKRVAFVMELLAGQALSDLMRSESLSIPRIAKLMRQVCSALEAAHKVGVVHRDVKPDNIYVTERSGVRDFVKVLDFGVAKLTRSLSDSPTVGTMEGVIIGTPAYMAPEQASGKAADFRADIYAVGVVLYELLAGAPPFDGEAFGQLLVQIVTQPPPPIAAKSISGEEIPEILRDLVMQCLAKAPEERPKSMAAIAEALGGFETHLADTVLSTRARRRSRWPVIGAGAAACLGLCAFADWAWFEHGKTAAAPIVATASAPAPVPPPPAPPMAEVPKVVTLDASSDPKGAKVVRVDTGEQLGITPFTKQLPRSDQAVTLRFLLPGHENLERIVKLEKDVDLDVIMVSQKAPAGVTRKAASKKKEKVSRDGVIDPFAN